MRTSALVSGRRGGKSVSVGRSSSASAAGATRHSKAGAGNGGGGGQRKRRGADPATRQRVELAKLSSTLRAVQPLQQQHQQVS